MKPILSTFLDYKQSSMEKQLELAKQLNLDYVMIRKINGKPIFQLEDSEVDQYIKDIKAYKVIAVDPLLESFSMDKERELTAYNLMLDHILKTVKKFKPIYYIYTIPKFDESIKNYKQVIEVVKSQIKIIKKHKLIVLIKMSDHHIPKMYRYILEVLNDKQVSIIFDYIYLHYLNESHVTAYRLLRNYIDLLIMDDIDQLGSGRVLGSGGHIDVTGIAKRFIKRKYEGFIVLDSSLVNLLDQANQQGWFSKLVSKKTKHEIKIYEDFVERYRSTDTFRVLRIQMAILSIMFLNKKIALG